MTVAAKPSVVTYAEDGVTTAFPAPFRYKDPSNLIVTRIGADLALTPLVFEVDYQATAGSTDAGGTVTVPAPSTGTQLRIERATPRRQGTEYTTSGRFPALGTENAFDTAMLIDQEQDDLAADTRDRAIMAPIGGSGTVFSPAAAGLIGIFGGVASVQPLTDILSQTTTLYDDGPWGGDFTPDTNDGAWG